jgi:glycosyltransferase involved in cell wall biosynthesis
MKIDIIVPIFNAAAYLPSFFQLLDQQTFKDFSLFFSDDASGDNSVSVIKTQMALFPNMSVRLFESSTNGGAGLARDRVLDSQCLTGDFVAFLDADDKPHSDFLEKMVQKAENTGADIIACGYKRVDGSTGKTIAVEMVHNPTTVLFDLQSNFIIPYLNTAVWNKFFKRSLIKTSRFGHSRSGEDALFYTNYLLNASSIAFVNEPLYDYVIRKTNRTSNTTLEILETAKEQFAMLSPDFHGRKDMADAISALVFLRIGIGMTTRAVLNNPKKQRSILKSTKNYLDDKFPNWRKNPYTNFWPCLKRGPKTLIVWNCRTLIKMNLFGLFIHGYHFVTKLTKKDVKW